MQEGRLTVKIPSKFDATVTARARAEFPPASCVGDLISQWRIQAKHSCTKY